MCDLETSRMGAPHIYDISRLRVKLLRPLLGGAHDVIFITTPLADRLLVRRELAMPA